MIDRDQLREAIADVDYMEATGVMVAKAGPIIEAARLVVEGREVEMCDIHLCARDSVAERLGLRAMCLSVGLEADEDCRMVRMILIDGSS